MKKDFKVTCHHCNQPAMLVTGAELYVKRPDLAHLKFWLCRPCAAYVGCHRGEPGYHPLGTLAKKDERHWRNIAHRQFDPIWKSGEMTRKEAYFWLAARLGIPTEDCHISHFGVEQCKQVYTACTGREAPKMAAT